MANEPGCLLYQLVKDGNGDYYVLELYQDKAALDAHFKGMGAKGAIPLSKIKYGASPLQIFPVVGGFLHQGESTIANFISLPMTNGPAFEEATVPALAEFDAAEPGTHAYILCKRPDESVYYFVELFQDQASIDSHSKSDTFKAMAKRQGASKAMDRSQKPVFNVNMSVCTSTTRKTVAAAGKASL